MSNDGHVGEPCTMRRHTNTAEEGFALANVLGIWAQCGEFHPVMRTDLDHLPEAKRRELALVVDLVRQGFTVAIEHRTVPRLRQGRLLKIILFGSYARGDWVEDPVGRYFSDYDLLVVVDHEDLTDVSEFWVGVEDALLAALAEGTRLRTPVSLVYHSLSDVNAQLRLGRYFFMDIVREGVVLFEEPDHPFDPARPLGAAEALDESRGYYEDRFKSALNFERLALRGLAEGMLNEAAFLMHQATERFYQCLFLVRTLYTPKTHNLNRLRALAEDMEPRLKIVWPTATSDQRRAYARLREAYIKARYSREYRITADQLAWLGERVAMLRELVDRSCRERLDDLQQAA